LERDRGDAARGREAAGAAGAELPQDAAADARGMEEDARAARGVAAEVPRRGGEVPGAAARPHPAGYEDIVERAHPRPDPAPALPRRPDRDAAARTGEGDPAVAKEVGRHGQPYIGRAHVEA